MPQGSVIGPLLFNVTLPSLAKILLQHALYGDDLTLWTAQGLNGNKQDVLQEAADDTTVEPQRMTQQKNEASLVISPSGITYI